jgi:hypothetical protein
MTPNACSRISGRFDSSFRRVSNQGGTSYSRKRRRLAASAVSATPIPRRHPAATDIPDCDVEAGADVRIIGGQDLIVESGCHSAEK